MSEFDQFTPGVPPGSDFSRESREGRILTYSGPRGDNSPTLTRDRFVRTAEIRGQIHVFRQVVLHRDNRVPAMDVQCGLEIQCRKNSSINVHKTIIGMVRHDMPTACGAELSMTSFGLPVSCQVLGTSCDGDVRPLPQSEGIYGRRRPGSTIVAMTITHCERGPSSLNPDGTAETAPLVRLLIARRHLYTPFCPGKLLEDGITVAGHHHRTSTGARGDRPGKIHSAY